VRTAPAVVLAAGAELPEGELAATAVVTPPMLAAAATAMLAMMILGCRMVHSSSCRFNY
jgi:hypothetical protein